MLKCAWPGFVSCSAETLGVSKDVAPMAEEGQVKLEEDEEDPDDSDEERVPSSLMGNWSTS